MNRYLSIIAIVLCTLILEVRAIGTVYKTPALNTTECECCKNCKDEKCKSLCSQWSNMSAETRASEEGKKVKAECLKICQEKKCCSTSGKATCEGMEGKGCCKKK